MNRVLQIHKKKMKETYFIECDEGCSIIIWKLNCNKKWVEEWVNLVAGCDPELQDGLFNIPQEGYCGPDDNLTDLAKEYLPNYDPRDLEFEDRELIMFATSSSYSNFNDLYVENKDIRVILIKN